MASSYGGGGGAGGKARKTSSRKPSTPYERPSAAGRGFRNSSEQSNSKGWLSKIVDPASKIIANGATRFFASVFQKRLTAPPVPLPENDSVGLVETNSELPVQVKEGPHEEAECREVNQATFLKNDSVDELEKMLTNKTLSRDDFNRLTQLLQSRVVDSPVGNEIERHQLPASTNAKAQIAPPSKDATHEITENLVLDEMIASPSELAKAYMGSRSARGSPTALRMNRRIYREVPSPRPLVPFVPMSPNVSLSHKPALKFSGIYGTGADGYNAPGSRGSHSALFNPLPSPYLSSPRNEAFGETRNHQGVSRFASPSILQSSETPSSSKQALKRRGSFLDHDIGPASSMRRIRQKSNLISPFRGIGSQPASSVSLLPSGSNARPGSYANEKPLLLNSPNASSSLNALGRENVRDNQNSFASVPPQSAETARRILEEINKLVPSPKDKQDDQKSVIARDGAPSKLTLSMLSGKARRSMDEIDVSRFQDLQEKNRFHGPGGPSLASPDESKAEIIGNGPAETSMSKAKSIKDATSRDKDLVAADTLSGLAKVSDSNGFLHPGIGHSFRMAVPDMEDDAENVMDLTASTFSEVSKFKPIITTETFSGLKSEKKPVFNVSGFDSKKMQNGPVFPSAATPSEPIKPPFSFIKPVDTTRDSEGDSVISSGLPAPSIFQGFSKATPVSAVAENNSKTLGSGSILNSDSRNGLISEGHKTEMGLDNDVKVQKPGENFPNSLPLFGSVPSSTSSGLGSLPPSVASTSALRVTTLSEVPGKSVQKPNSFSASLSVASNNQLGFGSASPTLPSSASMSSNVVALSTAKPSDMPSPFGFSNLSEQPKQIGSFSSTSSSGAFTNNATTEGTRLTNIAASSISMNETIKDQSNTSSSSPLFGSVSTPALDTGLKPIGSSSIFSSSSSAKASLNPSSKLFSSSNAGSENPFGTSHSSLASSAFNTSSSSSSTPGFLFGGSAGSGSSMLKFPFGGSSMNAASSSIGFSSGESSASVPPSLATAAPSVGGAVSGLTASSLGVTTSSPLMMESTKRQPNVTTSSSNLFSFDNSSSNASSTSQVSFGQSSTTFSAPATTGFSFGLMSSGPTASPATTGFTFGGSSQGASQSSPSIFSFGSSSAAASSSPSIATGFSFTSSSASGASSSVSTGFSFGGSSSSGLSSTTGYSFGSGAASSPATAGFSFGGSSAGSSPFSFGSSSVATSSTGSLFSFTAAGSSSTPTFGFPTKLDSTAQPATGFLSNSPGNDQMNVEDSMAEDTMQASGPTMPAFVTGSPAVGSIFGSPAGQVGASPVFPFGAPQGLPAPQSSPNPFASPPANLDFSGGSFSLGANGGDKSGRRIFRAKRDKTRKK